MTLTVHTLVLPAFAELGDLPAETEPWERAYEFTETLKLDGLVQPLRYTNDGLGLVPTGVGKSAAATTVATLCAYERVDLSDALILSVGVAGAPPSIPVGSVVVSDCIVDWDLKCRFPGDLAANPYVEQGQYDLNEQLVADIEEAGSTVELDGNAELRRGTNLSGDELWHGEALAEQADWLADQYDGAPYCVTEMEDSATAAALARFDRLDSYCAIRGVSNHDRPPEGVPARESFFAEGFEEGFGRAVENAVGVASAAVDRRAE